MKKILAIKNGISKLNNVAKFARVLFDTLEYFKDRVETEFPTDKPTGDVQQLSE